MADTKNQSIYMKYNGIKTINFIPIFFMALFKYGYMSRKIGVGGMAYFAMAFMVFLLFYAFDGLLIPDILKKLVMFQVNRRSVRNAVRLYRVTFFMTLGITLIFTLFLVFCSDFISMLLFGKKMASLLIKIFGVLLLFVSLQQCMRGYLEGMNNQLPGIVSLYICYGIDLVATILFQNPVNAYAQKVSLLMNDEQYYFAYSAVAGAVSVVIGNIFSFLFLLLVITLLNTVQKERIKADGIKSPIKPVDIIRNILSLGFTQILEEGFYIFLFVMLSILLHHTKGYEISMYGSIFLSLIPAIPVVYFGYILGKIAVRQVKNILRKGDAPHARERIAMSLKGLIFTSLGYVVFLVFCSSSFCDFVFDNTSEDFLSVFVKIQIVALVSALAVVLSYIAKVFVGEVVTGIIYFCGLVVSFFVSKMMFGDSMSCDQAMVWTIFIASFILILVNAFIVYKKIHFKEDLLRIFILPLVCGAIMAIVCFVIQKVFDGQAPLIAMLLSMVIGTIGYGLCGFMTRTFDRHEYIILPLSNIWINIAKLLHIY